MNIFQCSDTVTRGTGVFEESKSINPLASVIRRRWREHTRAAPLFVSGKEMPA